ncbi:hypothetical protein AVEN_78086-1 [Araneus ventricosus]|uniref:Ankyrin repeat domain-containing protein 54 n=1 Tax=Araneus ventricosus TaxID=182803 RepID=A0A4Y2F5C2_ARAVE|nr:hypothetical protein AVEN_78086-1 [Araneus ventricosus]
MMGDLEMFNIGDFETVPIYIKDISNADPNDQDFDGNTILHQYVSNHKFDPKVIESLINKGADLEIRNRTGKTVFLLAVVHRQKEMIESFIENGADVNIQDYMGNNALHYMALPELNHHWETVDNGLLFEVPDEAKFNFDDTYSILKILLNEGVDVNLMNQRRETPLMWAARGNHLDIVKMLLAFGANVHLQNENMETCLHLASTYNPGDPLNVKRWEDMNYAIVSELARNGACVNCFDKAGRTALGYILLSGHENNVYFAWELIKVAALVNWRQRIDFYLAVNRVLGAFRRDSPMISHANTCYYEIGRMKAYELPSGSNLCQFALGGVSEDEDSEASEINDQVLEILLQDSFPVYKDFIVSSFQRSYLRRKASEMVIYTRGEKRKVSLDCDMIFKLSSFLENSDLFNLISVFSSDIPLRQSLRLKR